MQLIMDANKDWIIHTLMDMEAHWLYIHCKNRRDLGKAGVPEKMPRLWQEEFKFKNNHLYEILCTF